MHRLMTLLFSAAMISACTTVAPPSPAVPDQLNPASNETLDTIVSAKGVQIYECRTRRDQTGTYEWAFFAPEAALYNPSGRLVGKHYAGPRWEANDGS